MKRKATASSAHPTMRMKTVMTATRVRATSRRKTMMIQSQAARMRILAKKVSPGIKWKSVQRWRTGRRSRRKSRRRRT